MPNINSMSGLRNVLVLVVVSTIIASIVLLRTGGVEQATSSVSASEVPVPESIVPTDSIGISFNRKWYSSSLLPEDNLSGEITSPQVRLYSANGYHSMKGLEGLTLIEVEPRWIYVAERESDHVTKLVVQPSEDLLISLPIGDGTAIQLQREAVPLQHQSWRDYDDPSVQFPVASTFFGSFNDIVDSPLDSDWVIGFVEKTYSSVTRPMSVLGPLPKLEKVAPGNARRFYIGYWER